MKCIDLWALDRPYPPLLMVPAAESTVQGFSRLTESKIKTGYNYWEKGKNAYFFKEDELKKTVEILLEKTEKDPNFLNNFLEEGYQRAIKLNDFSKQYKNNDLTKLSDQELIAAYQKIIALFKEMYDYGTIAPLIGYQDDNALYTKMNNVLKEKTKDNQQKFADYLVALTNPLKKLQTNDFESEILKIAKKAQERSFSTAKEIKDNFINEIKEVKSKYEYLSFDFTDSVGWDENYYIDLNNDF